MDTDEKLKFIVKELNDRIARYTRLRAGDKRQAFSYKVAAVCFAAAITVLLGLRVNATLTGVFSNVALVLGAMTTVVNTVDAFYDFRSLWIRRTIVLAKLSTLRRDVLLYELQPEQGESHRRKLDEFLNRLNQILDDDLQDWLKLRASAKSQSVMEVKEVK